MKYLESLQKNCLCLEHVSLSKKTWVGMGGSTPLFLEPRNREELVRTLAFLREKGLAFRVMGGGSNLLIHDGGVEEIVLCTGSLSRLYKIDEHPLRLGAEAGVSLARFVSTCHKTSLAGAESLIGIPGTLGGAAVMNAGGRHGSVGDLIRKATVITPAGELEERTLLPEEFGYRASPLKGEVVVEVQLELKPGKADPIWDTMTAILKEKRASQPLNKKSCGCVFRNPPGDSAGRLLDEAGMKGFAVGKARVSDLHANFIVNEGGAVFEDYQGVMEEGRRRVREKFGIDLELEIEIWVS